MTEREAQRLLDQIRTPEARAAMPQKERARFGLPPANARPSIVVGRWRYELRRNGRIWIYMRIGKGERWRLEPGETNADAYWLPREVREMVQREVGDTNAEIHTARR